MIATEPMTHQPTCSLVSCISSRTTDINGAMPNQAKKQRKKAIHVMWNARICGVEKSKQRNARGFAVGFHGGLEVVCCASVQDRAVRRGRITCASMHANCNQCASRLIIGRLLRESEVIDRYCNYSRMRARQVSCASAAQSFGHASDGLFRKIRSYK